MTDIVLVQASRVLPDAEVIAALPAMTKWTRLVTDSYGMPSMRLGFVPLDAWQPNPNSFPTPVFLNRHSTDPMALGFHDLMNGKPYGRSFSGDDILDRINPWVTLTHEIAEILGNGMIDKFTILSDGSKVPDELSDAVEDDIQAIVIDNRPHSNFVLPPYWTAAIGLKRYDYTGRLSGPCPVLTPGGYLPILRPGAKNWTQINEYHLTGTRRIGVRAERYAGSLRHRQLEAATISGVPAP
jgi:hypothetical protein